MLSCSGQPDWDNLRRFLSYCTADFVLRWHVTTTKKIGSGHVLTVYKGNHENETTSTVPNFSAISD